MKTIRIFNTIVFFSISSFVFSQNQNASIMKVTMGAIVNASEKVVDNNITNSTNDLIAKNTVKTTGEGFAKQFSSLIKNENNTSKLEMSEKAGFGFATIISKAIIDKKDDRVGCSKNNEPSSNSQF